MKSTLGPSHHVQTKVLFIRCFVDDDELKREI